MVKLLEAILEDDLRGVAALLKSDPRVTGQRVEKARMYTEGISHWIYAGDTPLHLAAAGYRVEIMRMLLAAGADVNAAGRHRGGTPLHYAADGYVVSPEWDEKRQVMTIQCLI